MILFSTDGGNDLHIDGGGQIAMCGGLAAYAQCAAALFRTVRGEHFLDVGLGIPHVDMMSGAKAGTEWRNALRSAAMSLPFVKEVKSLDCGWDSKARKMSYSMTLATDAGDAKVSG